MAVEHGEEMRSFDHDRARSMSARAAVGTYLPFSVNAWGYT